MNRPIDIDRDLQVWLEDGPNQLPSRVLDVMAAELDDITQRRPSRLPWSRTGDDTVNRVAMAVLGVAAALVLSIGVYAAMGGGQDTGTLPVTTPSARAQIDTSDWVPFTSERYAYTIAYPPTWTAHPATQAWTFETDPAGSDRFAEPNQVGTGVYPIVFTAFAVDVPSISSEDQWIADYYANRPWMSPDYCHYADAERRPISVDGHRATMIVGDTDCGDSAFVFIDGRVHGFWLDAYDRPAQIPEWRTLKTDLLEAFLSTVEFGP